MASSHNSGEKVVYVGDSRVRQVYHSNTPRDYSAYPGKSEVFIPNFLLKEWMVASVFLVGFLVLILVEPAPLGEIANPTDTGFIPMPDWYFLFLYQLLKYPYVANDFVVLGTVVIPGLAFTALTIVPFLDRGEERRFYKRPVATGLMLVSIAAIVFLTNVSWTHYQHELEKKGIKKEEKVKKPTEKKSAKVAIVGKSEKGYEIYQKSTCIGCHGGKLEGVAGPTLIGIGDKHDEAKINDIIKNGIGGMGAQYDNNISQGLTDADLKELAAWLAKQKKAQ